VAFVAHRPRAHAIVTRTASRTDGRLRVGCSGWSYDEWVGPFYPSDLPASQRLARYAQEFDTVEVNSTHYGTPSPSTVAAWAAAVPVGFEFCVKLHRFGTHRKRLLDPAGWAPKSVAPVSQLGARAGPVLLQLPPRWRPELGRLDAALTELRRAGAPPVAVEIRDHRWLDADADGGSLRDVLVRHGAALCHHDLLPVDGLSEPTAPFVYLRFHGPDPDHPYRGRYPLERLREVAGRCRALLDAGVDVHAFFNNDIGAAAPRDAAAFAAEVSAVPAERPRGR
jgi:uncharacterized protein YecE (DUF72 family)